MVLAERFLLEETIEERYTTQLNIYGTSNYAEKFTSTIAFWALFSIPYNSRWYAHLFEKMDLVKKMMELCSELTEIASSVLAKLSQEFESRSPGSTSEKQIQFRSRVQQKQQNK